MTAFPRYASAPSWAEVVSFRTQTAVVCCHHTLISLSLRLWPHSKNCSDLFDQQRAAPLYGDALKALEASQLSRLIYSFQLRAFLLADFLCPIRFQPLCAAMPIESIFQISGGVLHRLELAMGLVSHFLNSSSGGGPR